MTSRELAEAIYREIQEHGLNKDMDWLWVMLEKKCKDGYLEMREVIHRPHIRDHRLEECNVEICKRLR